MQEKRILSPAYPAIKIGNHVLRHHDEEIPDPYHGLDNLGDSETQEWIRSQERLYKEFVGNTAAENFLKIALDVPQKGIPVRVANGLYLFYYQDAGDEIPKLMISDKPDGAGQSVLIDPLRDGPQGNAGLKTAVLSPDGKLLAYSFLTNGSWESPLAIKNLDTGEDLSGNPHKIGFLWWDNDSKGFLYNQFSSTETRSIILRHHQLGKRAAEDPIVWEDKEHNASVIAPVAPDQRRHIIWRGTEEWLYPGVNNKPVGLMLKNPATGAYRKIFDFGIADYFPITKTSDGVLMVTTHDAPYGKIVLFNPDSPSPKLWKTIVPEHKNDALKHAFFQGTRLFVLYSHNAADRVEMFNPDGRSLGAMPIPEHSSVQFAHSDVPGTSVGISSASPSERDVMLSISNYQHPPTVYRYSIATNKLSATDAPSPNNFSETTIVEQLWCRSKDGTPIPIKVVRPKNVVLDGTAALKLSAYGGFGSQASPEATLDILNFVQSGGIYAFANIRGGGEFGVAWHEQGRRLNKQNSFDDFNACAEFLIDNNYTSSSRLIAEGTSNGGLVVLASMIQKPHLFGAVIANVPVADVLAAPHSNANEYGNVAEKAAFDTIKSYSPLQNILTNRVYPQRLYARARMIKT